MPAPAPGEGAGARPAAPLASRLELQLEQTALVVAVAAAAALLGWLAGRLPRTPESAATGLPEPRGAWELLSAGFESDAPILLLFACLLLVALMAPRWRTAAVARRNRELRDLVAASEGRLARANAELERLAFLDPLTQISNRRGFERALAAACSAGSPVALALVDVDRLKWVNDRFGHPAGDVVLRHTAQALERLASGDPELSAARIGGDEFGLVLSGRAATEAASRIAALLVEIDRVREPLPGICITLSVGWSRTAGRNDPAGLMRAADAALYQAKRGAMHSASELLPTAGTQGPAAPP
ncbi:MAG TPA: GGDEF domain-containing protein [Thermoanaerobaculia bacterium]|nr:GGDEF domain-containing protein [Thermoanaerobaculia bacterium]